MAATSLVTSRSDVEAAIRLAFAGVSLGRGVSLRQTAVIDAFGGGLSDAEFSSLRSHEITGDWAVIPPAVLKSEYIAHLDAEALRYYLPALMLLLLDDYGDREKSNDMWTIGTIGALDHRHRHPQGFLDVLTSEQRTAIALYVRALPQLVALDHEDARRIERALRDVWSRHLPREPG